MLSSCLATRYSAYFVVIYLFYAPNNVRDILAQHMLKQSAIYEIIFMPPRSKIGGHIVFVLSVIL